MGNENSTLGLSEETKAELQRSTEQLKQSEEKQQRRKAQAEEHKRAQAEVERRQREESYIAIRIAEKERLEAVAKDAKAKARAKPRDRPKAGHLRNANVAENMATETIAKQNLHADRPEEKATAAATLANAVLREDVHNMGKDAVQYLKLAKNERLAAEIAATAKQRADEEAKLKQRFSSMEKRKSLQTVVEQPSPSQGSEKGEIRETIPWTGTPLTLRAAANAGDPLHSRNLQDESTPFSASSTLDGWNARKQPRAKGSPNPGERPSSSSSGVVCRRDSKEPIIESQAQAADKVPASATQRLNLTPSDNNNPSTKRSTGHQGGSATKGQQVTYRPTTPPAAKKRPSISEGQGVTSLPPMPPAAAKESGTSAEAAMLPPKPAAGHKRPMPSGGFDMSNMPKIPKKNKQAVSSSASPRSPVQDDDDEAGERLADVGHPNWDGERQPPEWYRKLKAITKRDTGHSNVQVLLERLKEKIGKIKNLPQSASAERNEALNELREILHKVFFIEVTPQLLRNLRMLHNNDGLPQIFDHRYDDKVVWPYDLKADAEELYNKWCARTFEIDLLRGIRVGKPKTSKDKGSADRLDPHFPKVPSNYYGNGRLLNGQWWPTQLTALRDGAHGSSQGGIYGETGKGAYSVIMSGGVDKAGNKYPDVDEGDHVQYCGTDNDGPEKKPSDGTQRLIESYHLKTPVRLIRSSNADPAYAPEEGFRYDGLYEITDVEHMDPAGAKRQRHRFTLRRRPGQVPIRGSGPEKRPTQQELDAYKKDKTLRGYGTKG
ncbi:hypothetical protein AC579_6948 [Pseudocercospora musae]|uniref:YDG domain-containing protein n=1 Tax=Pseudocercospora musae TaxID=113226 RepID=A0A139IN85_9PEZI|nr:hypothetical protein AC579_6948 [Pseudocercospora musae]